MNWMSHMGEIKSTVDGKMDTGVNFSRVLTPLTALLFPSTCSVADT